MFMPRVSAVRQVELKYSAPRAKGEAKMNRIRSLVWSMTAMAAVVAADTARAQPTGEAGRGHAYARGICAQCHAVEKGQGSSPNPVAPQFEVIANVSGMTSTALRARLETSHRVMPNLLINSEDMRNVIAYILSLR